LLAAERRPAWWAKWISRLFPGSVLWFPDLGIPNCQFDCRELSS
jgi:hypothetical protein